MILFSSCHTKSFCFFKILLFSKVKITTLIKKIERKKERTRRGGKNSLKFWAQEKKKVKKVNKKEESGMIFSGGKKECSDFGRGNKKKRAQWW